MTFGHSNLLSGKEMRMMANAGVTATVTPEIECNMGHGFPVISRLMDAGIRPNIGVDTCIAVGADQFTAMCFALGAARAQTNASQLEAGDNPWELELTARDVLAMATVEGARALGQEDRIGSFAPGKQADLVLVDATHISMIPLIDSIAALVHHASRSTITDVFVAGRRLKRDGQLAHVNLARIQRSAHVAAAAVMERSGIDSSWKPVLPA